ncbi:MAG: low molecular weight protein-tyrosine-phosphatase [Methylococcaceae bacterium]|jgi:protein-tyrosine phosphatase
MEKIKVLFVCMGNICRSPTAEGVFTHLVHSQKIAPLFQIDSAGTHAYHIGDAPDLRSQKTALNRGIDISHLRGRKVIFGDFDDFDFILAMDDANHSILMNACPTQHQHKISHFLSFAPQLKTREVPDPYYGGAQGFDRVFDMIEAASEGFLNHLRAEKRLG